MRKFVKIFLISSLGFGIIWITTMSLYWKKQGVNLTLWKYLSIGVKAGLAFGFLLTISLAVIEYLSVKKLKIRKGAFGTKVEKKIIINLNYDESFEKVKKALSLIGAKVRREEKGAGIIVAHTGLSWKSFGEKIYVELHKLNSRQTQMRVVSKPKIWTTMIDFGKNFENVEKLCNTIGLNETALTDVT